MHRIRCMVKDPVQGLLSIGATPSKRLRDITASCSVSSPVARRTPIVCSSRANPSVISHENLVFTQPEYNTKVTISGRLKSERFARYAERYPDNEDYAALAGQDVSATVTVKERRGSTTRTRARPLR